MWHPKINQILAGCGNGKVKVFFDPQRSTRYLVMEIYQYLMRGGGEIINITLKLRQTDNFSNYKIKQILKTTRKQRSFFCLEHG